MSDCRLAPLAKAGTVCHIAASRIWGRFSTPTERGRSSVVEHNLAKVGVESSNLFARSNFQIPIKNFRRLAAAVLGLMVSAGAAQAGWRPMAFPVADVTLRAVATDGAGGILVSGSKGTIGASKDGGRTWRLVAPSEGRDLDFRGLARLGPRTGVAMSAGEAQAGRARLYRTDDGGATWTLAHETRRPGVFFDAVAFWDRRNGLALSDPVDGAWVLLRTSDGGRTWRAATASPPPVLPGEAAFAASNSALILGPRGRAWIVSGGGAVGRVFRSGDGGRTWRVADSPIAGGPTGGVFGGLALGGRRLVIVGGDHKDELRAGPSLALSADGGATWTASVPTGPARLLEGVGRLDARTLLAVGPRGTAISRDDGISWSQADTEAFHAIACARSRCVAVGANGRVGVWIP